MTARDHLSPHQFKFIHEKGELEHSVKAYHPAVFGGELPVGSIHWYHTYGSRYGKTMKPGEISNIEVQGETRHSPSYRGQGIGTRLYNEAQKYDPKPLHSTPSAQSDSGKKWVKKVGGPSV
jgi:GNAT superfamily N-acetyltransferase